MINFIKNILGINNDDEKIGLAHFNKETNENIQFEKKKTKEPTLTELLRKNA